MSQLNRFEALEEERLVSFLNLSIANWAGWDREREWERNRRFTVYERAYSLAQAILFSKG